MGKSPNDPRMQKSPEELCEAIDRAEARAEELARAYAAQLNDRKNFQTRLMREQQRAIDLARGKVTRELIDVADEIERALGAAQGDQGPLAQGIRLIHADLQKRLAAIGTRRLQMVGTRFDPNLAEAIEVLPVVRPEEDELVLEETRPGFMLGDQVVRPARVKVGRYTAPAQSVAEPSASGAAVSPREEAAHPEARPAADGGQPCEGARDASPDSSPDARPPGGQPEGKPPPGAPSTQDPRGAALADPAPAGDADAAPP